MYRNINLLRLAELIAQRSDKAALDEFHNHRSVFYRNSRPALLVDFLDAMRQSPGQNSPDYRCLEILDDAYDLTVSKFSNLPLPRRQKSDNGVKAGGPDCRYYFRAFLDYVKKKIPDCQTNQSIQMEIQVAKYLQKFVMRHFHLSCLECARRQQGLSRRYLWKTQGRSIPVWMPSYLSAAQCRDWLQSHIDGELDQKEQIQAVVDSHLQRNILLSLDRLEMDVADRIKDDLFDDTEKNSFTGDLATAVAEEKAENIDFQRPAIRNLGTKKIKQLIHKIFDGIAGGDLNAQVLAESFGLSGATFSRFASIRWGRDEKNNISNVPDLWSNTAEVLASSPDFVEVAGRAGVLTKIKQITESKN